MQYSRMNPSVHYSKNVAAWRARHSVLSANPNDAGYAALRGESIYAYAGVIKRMMGLTRAQTLLDYGSGQGFQYRERVVTVKAGHHNLALAEFWGAHEIQCYDPAFPPYAALPSTASDGVLVIDTLQYVPTDDLAWVISEIFSRARKFVFAVVGAPDAHTPIPCEAPLYDPNAPSWPALFHAQASTAGYENALWELYVNEPDHNFGKKTQRFGNFLWLDDVQRYPPLEVVNR